MRMGMRGNEEWIDGLVGFIGTMTGIHRPL